MQMLRVCACHTYADAWHMDMSCLYSFSSFSVKIRKKLKSDLGFESQWNENVR